MTEKSAATAVIVLAAGAGTRMKSKTPKILHAKHVTVDDSVTVLGSSNMDMRSMGLNYEISLLAFGGDMVGSLQDLAQQYRDASTVLTAEKWKGRSVGERYLNSVFRLTSALM